MDFSRVQLADDDQAFLDEARAFLAEHVTEDVIRRDRETGDNFDEGVHLALGAAGYLHGEWHTEERGRLQPGATSAVGVGEAPLPRAVGDDGHHDHGRQDRWPRSARPNSATRCSRRCSAGTRGCVSGYTEPEGGSDIATCKTRAVRDGDDWVINGSKMFTTGAHNCQYVFLITNTDPDAPKHKSITMFLVPLEPPGIEIQGIRTVDGDRTNIVYYSDVRCRDKYRLGEVNGGWTVLRGPLDAEHGAVDAGADGLQDVAIMMHQGEFMVKACDVAGKVVGTPDVNGRKAIDDDSVAYRLGRSVARMEVAISTPNIFGRVALAQTMRDVSPDLMDILGTASALPVGTEGAADDGAAEYVYRFAPLVGIYGGTLEVFRNMIAQHVLGLGKPNYSPPKKAP